MIWGAALAAGRQSYLRFGATPQAESHAVLAAQKLVGSFRALNKDVNCVEITDLDRSSTTLQMVTFFLLKGGFVGCCRMVARYASAALGEIEASAEYERGLAAAHDVSCAAVLARKMGTSEMHTVMAAGFAGGIGLCGGGCGALGAAIWIIGLQQCLKQGGRIDYKDPKLVDLIDRFLKSTGYRFECSEIVGRKFDDLDDHVRYLKDGGCAELLDELAAKQTV